MKSNQYKPGNIVIDERTGGLSYITLDDYINYSHKIIEPVKLSRWHIARFKLSKTRGKFHITNDIYVKQNNISLDFELFFKTSKIKTINYVHQLQNIYFEINEKKLEIY